MSIPAKITTRNEPAGWVAEVVTLEFDRCVFSTLPRPHEHRALEEARLWVLRHRGNVYQVVNRTPKGGVTVDIFDLEDFDLRR